MHTIIFSDAGVTVQVRENENLLDVIRKNGIDIQADCGGRGKCGKCTVLVDGKKRLACETFVNADMNVVVLRGEGDTYDILVDSGTGEGTPGHGVSVGSGMKEGTP
ncbi:MAG: 2Fe-2S iron-sulfur cluster binding domain-containing protein, partial [Clostridiales Family XIII bacterium]|nr:2Fe-2S iron-sulfur cluster binding domain-containing protein [Clostridiales Family XIII bacterium]